MWRTQIDPFCVLAALPDHDAIGVQNGGYLESFVYRAW